MNDFKYLMSLKSWHKDELHSTEGPAGAGELNPQHLAVRWYWGSDPEDKLRTQMHRCYTVVIDWTGPEENDENMSSDNDHTSSVPLSGLFYMRWHHWVMDFYLPLLCFLPVDARLLLLMMSEGRKDGWGVMVWTVTTSFLLNPPP